MQFEGLHVCEHDGWASFHLFERLVEAANAELPGPRRSRGAARRRLRLPLHALSSDHDFEAGTLAAFDRPLAHRPLPHGETVAGARVLFLDIVAAGSGWPDFRLGEAQTRWRRRELEGAQDAGQPAVVFMHAYPGDLHEGADEVAGPRAAGGCASSAPATRTTTIS